MTSLAISAAAAAPVFVNWPVFELLHLCLFLFLLTLYWCYGAETLSSDALMSCVGLTLFFHDAHKLIIIFV